MATDATPGPSIPTLSIIVPTYQESANIPILFERVKVALNGLPWEMIVVDDDSPDGTSDVAFALAAKDSRLRCVRRVNRSGLAGAVIEGWMSSSADFVAAIDGDLQRFVLFAMIGAGGLIVHIVTLSAVIHWFGALTFNSGQLIATVVAMASNFVLNNEITYSSYIPWPWPNRGVRGFCARMQRRGCRQYRHRLLAL
jgi:glycosyltransferase involved in cell wall biosynthesis